MTDSNERIEAAFNELSDTLQKMFLGMGEPLTRKFQLDPNELFVAIGKATMSSASVAFATAVDGATPSDGLRLRRQLTDTVNKWLAEMRKNQPGDRVAS